MTGPRPRGGPWMGRGLRVAGALGVACVLAVWAAAPASASVGPRSCADVSASTQENQSVTVSFSCTGLISSYSIIGSPSHGSLATIDQSAGTVTYTPHSGNAGSALFTYQTAKQPIPASLLAGHRQHHDRSAAELLERLRFNGPKPGSHGVLLLYGITQQLRDRHTASARDARTDRPDQRERRLHAGRGLHGPGLVYVN